MAFEYSVPEDTLAFVGSCMKVSSTLALPEKDFKAVVHDGMVPATSTHLMRKTGYVQKLIHRRT